MAFSVSNLKKFQGIGGACVTGTYTNTNASTGGDIDTYLSECYAMFLQPKTSAVVTSYPVVNKVLPANGKAVTIVTSSNETGYFVAFGV